jgi:hypothetical protein
MLTNQMTRSLGQVRYKVTSSTYYEGGYGTVKKCIHKASGATRAVKMMKKSKI